MWPVTPCGSRSVRACSRRERPSGRAPCRPRRRRTRSSARARRVGARLLQRLADVVHLELAKQLDVVEHLPADRAEDAAALDRAEPAPRAGAAVSSAARAAATAASMSAPPPRPRRASSLPSEGSSSAIVAAAAGSAPFAADQEAIGREGNRECRGSDRACSGRAAALRHHKNLAPRRGATAISFFLFKRFASLCLTLLAASLVVFIVLEVLPGNAAEVMLGPSATPDTVAALRAKLGLDRPAPAALCRLDRRPAHRRSRHQLSPTTCRSPS